jgi:hypothetical protein
MLFLDRIQRPGSLGKGLSGIAHPDFRDELVKQAEKYRTWRRSNSLV